MLPFLSLPVFTTYRWQWENKYIFQSSESGMQGTSLYYSLLWDNKQLKGWRPTADLETNPMFTFWQMYFSCSGIWSTEHRLTGGSELYSGLCTCLQSINLLNYRTKNKSKLNPMPDKFFATPLLVKLHLRTSITHSGKSEMMIPAVKC